MSGNAEQFNTDEIDDCIDSLKEVAEVSPDEVERILKEEVEPHMTIPRHMRPFAEEWPEVAKMVGLVK